MWFLNQVKNKRTYSTLSQLSGSLSILLGTAGYPVAAAVPGGAAVFSTIMYYVMKNREIFRGSEELHREIVALTERLQPIADQQQYPLDEAPPRADNRPDQILGYYNYSPESFFFNTLWGIALAFSVLLTLFSTLSSYDSESDAGTKRTLIFVSSVVAIIGPLLLTMLTAKTLRQHQDRLRVNYGARLDHYIDWVNQQAQLHNQPPAAIPLAQAQQQALLVVQQEERRLRELLIRIGVRSADV